MKKKFRGFSFKSRRLTAVILLSVFFSSEVLPLTPVLEAMAIPTESRILSSFYDSEDEDLWEKIEAHGDVLLTFPSQIHSTISSPEDTDVFNFTLEDPEDVILTLESSEPCQVVLSDHGVVVEESSLPHDQSIERAGLTAGTYTVTVSPQPGTDYAEYELKIRRQTDKTVMPDYSEAHIAGVTFNKRSPYRWMDLEDDELDRGGSSIEVLNYLAHWQGPVKNSAAPYPNDGSYMETPSNYIKYVDASRTSREYHIPNAYMLPTSDTEGYKEHWKNAIMTYSAIHSGLYFLPPYYTSAEPGYLYLPPELSDELMGGHATTIVGWDDSVPKEKFTVSSGSNAWTPEEDGAWICKDSYGTDPILTDGTGYYYISYEDAFLGYPGMLAVVYPAGERIDNYSHMYSNSANGSIDLPLEDYTELILSQVFHTGHAPEMLRAAGFILSNPDFSYRIYVRIGEDKPFLAKSGYEKYGGFHTERLDTGILLPAETEFEVIVKILIPEDRQNILRFFFAHNTPGWIDGIKSQKGISYQYELLEDGTWERHDISENGLYPSIFAYTNAPSMKEKITLTNIREPLSSPANANQTERMISSGSNAAKRPSLSEDGMRTLPNPLSIAAAPLHVNLPSSYDLRDENQVTVPKHQGISSLCWTFAAAAAMESGYLKGGSNMVNYPGGLNLYSEDGAVKNGKIKLALAPGEELPIDFTATLFSDSEYFNPGTDQIYWEIAGDMSSIEAGDILSESGESVHVLTARSAGTVRVTAVSLADHSLRTSCTVEITEKIPAKVHLDRESLTLTQGETCKLQVTVESDEEVTVFFSSDNPSIADVSPEGEILALRPGTAVITARAGEGYASCTVTVTRRSSSSDSSSGNSYSPAGPGSYSGFIPSTSITSDTTSGTWILNSTGWWLQREDGTYPSSSWERINGKWYYFKESGYIAAGWINQNGFWYYLSEDAPSCGQMATGWIFDPAYGGWFYLKPDGTMVTGWNTIDGKQYYFNPVSDGTKGRMAEDTVLEDGTRVGKDGAKTE
ncbi:MAG: lectin like domain-containing protein [Hungatella hathewayi]|uniref:lectin like domain-containing protein n=1 Tax=Hungatella TaxID=1649459 RepID=UPI00110700D3|nr:MULTISPECIES: lectin like domain-containing protein [Hungatella]MCI7383768.1 lectin like domain-containing protein [Hungatella sp.]MDY6239690.1 lectin like domain-containing protein [Hungatella hathewayi]